MVKNIITAVPPIIGVFIQLGGVDAVTGNWWLNMTAHAAMRRNASKLLVGWAMVAMKMGRNKKNKQAGAGLGCELAV